MRVADTAVARVAARRARQIPGVVGLRADLARALLDAAGAVLGRRREPMPTDGVSAVVHGDAATVSVAVVSTLGHNCRDLAQAVQREVAEELATYTGLDIEVRVSVIDIWLD